MKKGFHYEKHLPHQQQAVSSILSVFHYATKQDNDKGENPTLALLNNQYQDNIRQIQKTNAIDKTPDFSHILDIAMETGTGKTYTYTQTMYEMHKTLGVYKFVIVVPTLSIKAGTEQFLKSDALKNHFRLDFDNAYGQAQIELYVVESQKAKKGKRISAMPSEIIRFVQADNAHKIHVLLLNMGMVNSKTMKGEDSGNDGSVLLKDKFNKPFEAIASVRPILIIDEPHRFDDSNKTWQGLMSFSPQYILRYGATFNDKFKNLIYRLSAIDAFNQDLVKGVTAHIQEIQGDNKTSIKFIGKTDTGNALFELNENGKKRTFSLSKGENLKKIHQAIDDLVITDIGAKKSLVVLNNTVQLELNETIKPFSYANQVTDTMMRSAIRSHFDNERTLLNRADKIKPLTLFFIDDIAGYRDGDKVLGSLKNRFEQMVKAEAQKALKTAEVGTAFYHSLQAVLNDVSATHGGYFSKDNSTDDEKIAQEVSEILHDKESLLSLTNPRRFIFSKWTLREGWDNPNVFGICKLRSSGSETSKLQEVGRGLRLPVNEYMSRVKDGDFKLNYFVDSSESDFVAKLKAEINQSGEREVVYEKFNEELFGKIQTAYPEKEYIPLMMELNQSGWIDANTNFTSGGFEQLKRQFPNAFTMATLKNGKISDSKDKSKTKVAVRVGKYDELKTLWEAINQKAVLQYQMSESDTLALFKAFLQDNQKRFTATGISIQTQKMIKTADNRIDFQSQTSVENELFEPIITMGYREFLTKLAQKAYIQMHTLHRAFFELKDTLDIRNFMNDDTIRFIVKGFNDYLLAHSLSKFEVGYQKITSQVHPTKLTDKQGKALAEIDINQDWGVVSESEIPLDSFLFDKVFFDCEIEHQNVTDGEIKEVVVFTKIPKKAIKIPVAGGETYSPDFAYIVKTSKGERLNLVVESKGMAGESHLRDTEKQKIRHAERWFRAMNQKQGIEVKFVTQFEQDSVVEIIKSFC